MMLNIYIGKVCVAIAVLRCHFEHLIEMGAVRIDRAKKIISNLSNVSRPQSPTIAQRESISFWFFAFLSILPLNWDKEELPHFFEYEQLETKNHIRCLQSKNILPKATSLGTTHENGFKSFYSLTDFFVSIFVLRLLFNLITMTNDTHAQLHKKKRENFPITATVAMAWVRT